MTAELDLALECARRAADIVARGFASDVGAEFKGTVDPVTAIDRAAEDAVRTLLAAEAPDDRILGEERGGGHWAEGRVWIVDPLDGTVNFIHRLPQVAVSIGLWEDGKPVAGVVRDALGGEVFAAESGAGATLDGSPVETSTTSELSGALVATGFPYDRQQRAGELAGTLAAVLSRVQGIRRIGSAALDICWVAAGRFDAYWESGLEPWDAAAGVLVATEAGCRVTDLDGSPHLLDAPAILCSNGVLHDDMLGILGSA